MVDFQYKDSYGVQDLEEIVRILRAPGGCPWDAEQTHQSIRRNFLEESYEAVEAIDEGSAEHLQEELGDVLLQVALHAEMERELGHFDLNGVADGICKKLIFRHPHVFPPADRDPNAPAESWEALKRREKGQQTHTEVLQGVARTLPALWRAEKLQAKAEDAGFQWPGLPQAMDKLEEELAELKQAQDQDAAAEELGDLLFAAVKVSRFLHIDPDTALCAACDKFIRRFAAVEAAAAAQGQAMEVLPLSTLMAFWTQAKAKESSQRKERENQP